MISRHAFRFLQQPDEALAVHVDGETVSAPRGISVAALLLSLGKARRTHVLGDARAPHCLMGVCFECLVTVDGVGNLQGCLVEVAEGMDIAVQDHE
jgi:sarcosine oxidase subunit alpha